MATKKQPLKKRSASKRVTTPKDAALVAFDQEALERLADAFLLDYEYDEKRIAPLVGFLQYLVTVAKNPAPAVPFGHVDDIVHVVNQRIFGNVSRGFSQYTRDALKKLHLTLSVPHQQKA